MTQEMPAVTLQINLTPSDLPHAEHILPHQLRQWAGQVSEVLFVIETSKGRGPRFEGWTERIPGLHRLIEECSAKYPHVACVDVDYSASAADELASALFAGHRVPRRAWDGTAVYPYFFGLHAAKHNYVFHIDSDMMFGGGSQTWVAEAVRLLRRQPDVLACNPLPGPPTADGRLTSQRLVPEPSEPGAFRSRTLSTRLFLMDRDRAYSRVGAVRLTQPPRRRIWQAIAEGRPPYDLAEQMLSRAMAEHGLLRIDFLGAAPGMWSLHPPYRSKLFYDSLPRLIQQVETGDIPEAQRGAYDINDSFIDWSSAQRSRSSRLRTHAELVASNVADRLRRDR
jgi:hypothetical protein